jgi:hypothetical protein
VGLASPRELAQRGFERAPRMPLGGRRLEAECFVAAVKEGRGGCMAARPCMNSGAKRKFFRSEG